MSDQDKIIDKYALEYEQLKAELDRANAAIKEAVKCLNDYDSLGAFGVLKTYLNEHRLL